MLATKVIRKFEGLNLSLIRDEINPLIEYLDRLFGKDAMRECICGLYGDYYIRQLAFLLLFVAAALLIGLLVRRPFMGLNRFMEEKLEETELL